MVGKMLIFRIDKLPSVPLCTAHKFLSHFRKIFIAYMNFKQSLELIIKPWKFFFSNNVSFNTEKYLALYLCSKYFDCFQLTTLETLDIYIS